MPRKGPVECAVKTTGEDLGQSGMCRFLCKSDGEPAINALNPHAARQLRVQLGQFDVIFAEVSLQGLSKMRWLSERSVEVQSYHRMKLPLTHTVRICATEYGAHFLNRSQRAVKDGIIAYTLCRGKSYRMKIATILEKLSCTCRLPRLDRDEHT